MFVEIRVLMQFTHLSVLINKIKFQVKAIQVLISH